MARHPLTAKRSAELARACVSRQAAHAHAMSNGGTRSERTARHVTRDWLQSTHKKTTWIGRGAGATVMDASDACAE